MTDMKMVIISEPKNDNSSFVHDELGGTPLALLESKLGGTPQVVPDESAFGKTGGAAMRIARYESKTGGTAFAKQFKA